jgi:two-component system heavy metal sensor histidine kinase CusS
MSLRGRFVTASSVVALVTLAGASSVVWLEYNAAKEGQLDAALLAEAKEDALDASFSDGPPSGGRPALRRGELGPITKYSALYDSNGQAVAWTPNLELGRPRMEFVHHTFGLPFDLWWNNEHLRAVLVPLRSERGQSLLLATPRMEIDGDARDLARRMVAAALVAVVASAAATSWLVRRLTRDHDRIAAVARAVAAGDLSARIGRTSSDPEIARLGQDVDEMISRLAVLVETQQRFIANASHELRSPVTTLLGELSFALRRDRDAATYRGAIEEALDSTRRLKVVTEDLLALARVGAADLRLESVPLSKVTRAAVESTRAAADAREVALEITCDGPAVQGHAGDLERLLRNLIENAIRHSPRGGRVHVDAQGEVDHVHLRVTDDGPGIPYDVRERIFEPFFRLAGERAEHAGAGLGLAIGRSIARAHGGDLWVDDSSHGARFVVRLPVSGPTAG